MDTNERFIKTFKFGMILEVGTRRTQSKQIYTTKHYVAGLTILRFWRCYLELQKDLDIKFQLADDSSLRLNAVSISSSSSSQVVVQSEPSPEDIDH